MIKSLSDILPIIYHYGLLVISITQSAIFNYMIANGVLYSHYVAFKTPFSSNNLVIDKIIGTTRDSVNCIVAAHYTCTSCNYTLPECREIGLQNKSECMLMVWV